MELRTVPFEPQPLETLGAILDGQLRTFMELMHGTARRLNGRTLWSMNSTAQGGGVAEMLGTLLPYAKASGWNVRWAVVAGDPDFFRVTKGLHNALHGSPPADDIWTEGAAEVYTRTTERNAAQLRRLVRPGDIVFVHDPQAAGLIAPLRAAGARVSWQCHVGTDVPNDHTYRAWSFLRRFVQPAERYVFSRDAYEWNGLDTSRLRIIQPSIDALSPKNAPLSPDQVRSILAAAGILDAPAAGAVFARSDGEIVPIGSVERVGGPAPIPADARIVLEVSRWDRLKDPIGLLRMHAEHLGDLADTHLIFAGPSTAGIDDDPEGAEVLGECTSYWNSLEPTLRDRIHLLQIPMDDLDANAVTVNALQHRADVVVQKSIQEGFGLTVTEAMWKARPVVASRVGGIQDQIEHGRSGLLVDDPRDDKAFADAVRWLLANGDVATDLGRRARERVQDNFLHTRQLRQYADLVGELL